MASTPYRSAGPCCMSPTVLRTPSMVGFETPVPRPLRRIGWARSPLIQRSQWPSILQGVCPGPERPWSFVECFRELIDGCLQGREAVLDPRHRIVDSAMPAIAEACRYGLRANRVQVDVAAHFQEWAFARSRGK